LYRYDPKLGWFPREARDTSTGSQTISASHNSRGFRDNEHHPSETPGLLFIGDWRQVLAVTGGPIDIIFGNVMRLI